MRQILVKGGIVVTVDPQRRVIKDGAVLVEGQRIAEVGKSADLFRKHPQADVLEARGKMILPGLIDAHIHLTQMMARGLTDDIDGIKVRWSWERVFPWEARLTSEDVYFSAMLCAIGLIKTGTTCFADPGGYSMGSVAKAVEESGLRGIIAVASVDQSSPEWPLPEGFAGEPSTERALAESEELIQSWHHKFNDRLRVWTSLRVEPNVSEALIMGIARLAQRYDVGIQNHCSVSRGRRDWVKKITGHTPVVYYHNLGVLSPRWLLTHMSWVTEEELPLLKEYGVHVCHCPGAALHGAGGAITHGKFPEMIAMGVNVCLGCDSSAADNSLDMIREMYHVATLHKEWRSDGTLISPEQALEMATLNGAKALHWDREIGSIEAGKKADLIIVNTLKSNWIPIYDFSIIPNLVYAGEGQDVETVIIDGEVVMRDKTLLTLNEQDILREAQKRSEALVTRLPYQIKPRWPVS